MLAVNSYPDRLGLSLSIPHKLCNRELFVNSILNTAVSTCESGLGLELGLEVEVGVGAGSGLRSESG